MSAVSYIRSSPALESLEVVGFFLFVIMAVYGLNQWALTQNGYWLYLVGLSVLYLFLLVSPRFIGPPVEQSNPTSAKVYQAKITPMQEASMLVGTLACLVVMVVTWLAVPDVFGASPSLVKNLSLTTAVASVFGVTVVFGQLAAIAEERFTRFAVMNWLLGKTQGSTVIALAGSAVSFWIIHIPRYYSEPSAQAIILIAGGLFGFVDLRFRSLAPSTASHMFWNLTVSGLSAVGVTSPVALAAIIPVAMVPLALAHAPAVISKLAASVHLR
jgi:membrane protease YdiL (CAAX protease family)